MVTSHTKGEKKYSTQSDSRSKHDTETANKTKSATLVKAAQVYGACEATVCIRTQRGRARERERERLNGGFTKANELLVNCQKKRKPKEGSGEC